jgi:UDP-glucose 4-epimerase
LSDTFELKERIAGSSVLVTGGSGFIGTHLCRQLVACHAKVHVVSRDAHRADSKNLQWWQVDLGDPSAVCRVVKAARPRIVIHLASYVGGARNLDVVLPTFHGNLASTVHLLTAAAEAGCQRIVLANSSEEPQYVDDTTFPCSPYTAAKLAGSIYGRMFYQLFQTPVVMPRIFMTYGPNQKDMQKLVPFVICKLLCGESPKLGSGRRRADWIYVEDVVDGLLRAAVVPGIEGNVFDLGTTILTSVRGIVEQIVEIVDNGVEPAFDILPDRPFEQERAADTSFLLSRLGYQPRTSLKQGLEATVAWYRRQLGAMAQGSTREVAVR